MQLMKGACSRLAFLLLSIYALTGKAQQVTVYYDSKDQKVESRDSARYTRIYSKADSANRYFDVREYYKDSTLKFAGRSSSTQYLSRVGECIDYFPNGKMKRRGVYINDYPEGEQLRYFPDGKTYLSLIYPPVPQGKFVDPRDQSYTIQAGYDLLGHQTVTEGQGYSYLYDDSFSYIMEQGPVKNGQRDGQWKASADSNKIKLTETYAGGKLLTGTAFYKDGSTSSYSDVRSISPDYKGGMQAFYTFLASRVHYPAKARKNGIQGRVIVQFIVERDGSLSGVKVLRSPSQDLAEESVKAVSASPNWIPGKQYGRDVRVQYTIPIEFHLNGG